MSIINKIAKNDDIIRENWMCISKSSENWSKLTIIKVVWSVYHTERNKMKNSIETLKESNKQFFTPDDVSPVVGMTAQKIRDKAYIGEELGFEYECVPCGTGQRKPRVKIPRDAFLKKFDESNTTEEKKAPVKSAISKNTQQSRRVNFPNTIFYTVTDIAEMLKVSHDTVYEWVASGELESYRFGKQYRISDEAFQTFMLAHSMAA